MHFLSYFSSFWLRAGETTAMPIAVWSQRARMAIGLSHQVHQSHWWSPREGRSLAGPQKWTGQLIMPPPPKCNLLRTWIVCQGCKTGGLQARSGPPVHFVQSVKSSSASCQVLQIFNLFALKILCSISLVASSHLQRLSSSPQSN